MITMVSLIVKSYLAILLPVGVGSMCLLMMGFYWIFRKKPPSLRIAKPEAASTSVVLISEEAAVHHEHDVRAIAGDNVLATQLDLARAYIETGKKQLAKKILDQVMMHGDQAQQDEARNLLGFI